jgi:hypothetical protein
MTSAEAVGSFLATAARGGGGKSHQRLPQGFPTAGLGKTEMQHVPDFIGEY